MTSGVHPESQWTSLRVRFPFWRYFVAGCSGTRTPFAVLFVGMGKESKNTEELVSMFRSGDLVRLGVLAAITAFLAVGPPQLRPFEVTFALGLAVTICTYLVVMRPVKASIIESVTTGVLIYAMEYGLMAGPALALGAASTPNNETTMFFVNPLTVAWGMAILTLWLIAMIFDPEDL